MIETSSQARGRSWLMFAAAAAATCAANATWWMQPLLMHELAVERGLQEFYAGIIISVEMAALALTTVVAARLLAGFRLRALALAGIGLALVAGLVSPFADNLPLILVLRALCGVGAGLALTTSNIIAARFPDPDKAFARMSLCSIFFGVVLVGSTPILQSRFGVDSIFWIMSLGFALLLPIVFALPSNLTLDSPQPAAMEIRRAHRRRIFWLAGVTFATGCASGIMWVFYFLIGQEAGLSAAGVDTAISIAILAAICSTGLASLIGSQFGRLAPMGGGLLLLGASIFALSNHPGPLLFQAATMGNVAAIYFLTPYLFGAAADADSTGRGAVYVGGAFFLTGAVGPALGGFIAEHLGMAPLGIISIVLAVGTFLLFVAMERASARASERVILPG